MTPTRRSLVAATLAAPVVLRFGLGTAQAATTLKLSHQFPGGTIDEGDFRDRMCRKFAKTVGERSKGALEVQVYPGSSLMKTNAQFGAMRKGALDMSLYPSPYAGGEVPELNIGLMPALVTSYAQAVAWKTRAGGPQARRDPRREGHHPGLLGLAGGRRRQPRAAARLPGRRQGHEGPRRLARDGHDDEGGGRRDPVDPVERILRGDADRRLRRGDHLVHQPDLVPPGGAGQGADLGPGAVLLVHARADHDVQDRVLRACRRTSRT